MEEQEISTQRAIEVTKEYFAKLKGADQTLGNRKMIDWLEFDVIQTEIQDNQHIITCELLSNLYAKNKERYNISINKLGRITKVNKEQNGQRLHQFNS